MVADTLRQKYIYAIPYDKDEFPLVNLDKGSKCHMMSFAYLFKKNGIRCNII